jgi:O-phosphoseryl-tRNA(Sec) kinase
MEASTNLCYLICCGLPASGKTRLAQMLCHSKTKISSDSQTLPVLFIHICYDELISDTTSDGQSASNSWKEQRQSCLSCVEYLTRNLKDPCSCDSKSIHCSFCLRTSITIKQQLSEKFGTQIIFIIDDTMHLKSMRYQYFQLARRYCTGFAVVHLVVDVNEALRLNNKRHNKEKIDDEIIKNMEARFEMPCKDSWEANTVQVCWQEMDESRVRNLVMKVIKEGLHHPVMPLVTQEEVQQRCASKLACSKSIMHQADLLLRKLTSHLIAQRTASQEFVDTKCFALLVANAKLKTLQDVREHSLQLQIGENVSKSCDTTDIINFDSYFTKFVKDSFQLHLSEENVVL